MKPCAPCIEFEKLLSSEAKGFFYLKFALTDHTTEETLDAILSRAHAVYDQALARGEITSFTPSFVFVCQNNEVVMRIQKAETSCEPEVVVGEIALQVTLDPISRARVLRPAC